MAVEPGTYQHWKGPQYLVLGLGHDANDGHRALVVYLPLYPIDGPPFAVRTLEDFCSWVDPETGEATEPGDGVQRFRRVDGPSASTTSPLEERVHLT
jgi:hypothetical protein